MSPLNKTPIVMGMAEVANDAIILHFDNFTYG